MPPKNLKLGHKPGRIQDGKLLCCEIECQSYSEWGVKDKIIKHASQGGLYRYTIWIEKVNKCINKSFKQAKICK